MSARDGFVLGCRLLANYLLIQSIAGALQGYVYFGYMQQQFQLMGHYSGDSEHPFAYLVAPAVNFFSALMLWFYSPPLAPKVFPTPTEISAEGSSGQLPRILARLLAIYFIISGIAGLAGYFANKAIEIGWLSGSFYESPPRWQDLTTSLVWLIGGLVLHIGAGRVVGGIKGIGNAIADDLWRIKPEEDEPETKA